jgi:hypothetical protein
MENIMSTHRGLTSLVLSAIALIMGCSSEQTSTDGTAASVSAAASQLEAAQRCLGSTKTAASACFDTYRACESAAGADAQACRDALSQCLPTDAKLADSCAVAQGKDNAAKNAAGGAGNSEDRAQAKDNAAAAGAGNQSETDDDDAAVETDDTDDESSATRRDQGVAGASSKDEAESDTARTFGEKLSTCNVAADTNLSQGTDPSTAAVTHQDCVGKAMSAQITDLCQKATDLCSSSSSTPADACKRVSDICSKSAG